MPSRSSSSWWRSQPLGVMEPMGSLMKALWRRGGRLETYWAGRVEGLLGEDCTTDSFLAHEVIARRKIRTRRMKTPNQKHGQDARVTFCWTIFSTSLHRPAWG